jgi:hypothetical protein
MSRKKDAAASDFDTRQKAGNYLKPAFDAEIGLKHGTSTPNFIGMQGRFGLHICAKRQVATYYAGRAAMR